MTFKRERPNKSRILENQRLALIRGTKRGTVHFGSSFIDSRELAQKGSINLSDIQWGKRRMGHIIVTYWRQMLFTGSGCWKWYILLDILFVSYSLILPQHQKYFTELWNIFKKPRRQINKMTVGWQCYWCHLTLSKTSVFEYYKLSISNGTIGWSKLQKTSYSTHTHIPLITNQYSNIANIQ